MKSIVKSCTVAALLTMAADSCSKQIKPVSAVSPRFAQSMEWPYIFDLVYGPSVPEVPVLNQTISFALDRIDQHDLPLDKKFVHEGTGKGVVVYVFDGGVLDTHPELSGRVRRGYTALPLDPLICNAHGTAVAGAIAGRTLGVAPGAEIVDVKMVECSKGSGMINSIVDGVNWVLKDHEERGGPAVANWSFIADTASHIPQLDSAVARLRRANIPVVVSAGNVDINACRVSPGNAAGAIVVGATALKRDPASGELYDGRAENTAYGPCIDIYAPGDSILLPSFDAAQTPNVQLWHGTSMATAFVSGALALYFESHPHATPDEALQYLRARATLNIVRESYSPFAWFLFVGNDAPVGKDKNRTLLHRIKVKLSSTTHKP